MTNTFPTVAEVQEYFTQDYAPVGWIASQMIRRALRWLDKRNEILIWRDGDGWQVYVHGYYGPHELAVTMPNSLGAIAAMYAMKGKIDADEMERS